MSVCFLGSSHAAVHLRNAAALRFVEITTDPLTADVVFVSEDTPTDDKGNRDLTPIRELVEVAKQSKAPIVITSQVPPGFTRSLDIEPARLFHQAETLRIKDAEERAMYPDYIVVGAMMYQSYELLPTAYRAYLDAFPCEKLVVVWEDAEFSKIAVNMMLAAQVDATNMLADAARKCGASWWQVADVLHLDARIGKSAYLNPGRWQDSLHLLRDWVTLNEICTRQIT
jgi:UDPglucose 6-dehydrogenase